MRALMIDAVVSGSEASRVDDGNVGVGVDEFATDAVGVGEGDDDEATDGEGLGSDVDGSPFEGEGDELVGDTSGVFVTSVISTQRAGMSLGMSQGSRSLSCACFCPSLVPSFPGSEDSSSDRGAAATFDSAFRVSACANGAVTTKLRVTSSVSGASCIFFIGAMDLFVGGDA